LIYSSTTRAYATVAGDVFEDSFSFRDYGGIVTYMLE